MMRLVRESDGTEVTNGDAIFDGDRECYIDYIQPPHKPGSTGRITARYPDGETTTYFPSVFDLKWIEREDQGWEHPEVVMRKVFDIIKKNTGEDVSGYNLDTAIAGIRQIYVSDERYTGEELRYIKDWLNEQELPEMLKKQSGI